MGNVMYVNPKNSGRPVLKDLWLEVNAIYVRAWVAISGMPRLHSSYSERHPLLYLHRVDC